MGDDALRVRCASIVVNGRSAGFDAMLRHLDAALDGALSFGLATAPGRPARELLAALAASDPHGTARRSSAMC